MAAKSHNEFTKERQSKMENVSNAQPRTRREIVEFPPNVPVTVALKYNQGKLVAGQYGERMMFTTTDNRVLFLDPATAGQITALGINVRENFIITQRWDRLQNSPRTWEVARAAGEQPNGTLILPGVAGVHPTAAAQVVEGAPPPKPPASAGTANLAGARSLLVQEADSLVDAYAQVLERALTTYQGRIKPDEVRSLLLSAYIQRRQLSTCA
jgi:hypothetical protein